MRWDDWLFIVMFFGVVPGAITLFGRRLAKDSPWHQLSNPDHEAIRKAMWRSILGIQIGTPTTSTTIKGISKVAVVDGCLIIRPGFFARYMGFRPKSVRVNDCKLSRSFGGMKIKVGDSSFHLTIVPFGVAQDLLQKQNSTIQKTEQARSNV
ncbi:MAG: hypothetical protein ABI600_02540 [Luteolibacter sp.]